MKPLKTILVTCLIMVVLDIVFKLYISKNYEIGQYNDILFGLVTIGYVPIIKMASGGFGTNYLLLFINTIKICFQLLIFYLFFRSLKLNISSLLKLSLTLLVFGWFENYLDKFLISNTPSYQNLEYFKIAGISSFWSISTIMILSGWLLLIISIIIKLKDLKTIWKGSKHQPTT